MTESHPLPPTDSVRLSAIHRRFRLAMNGVVADLLRRKGLRYKIIFGLQLPQIKAIADSIPRDAELARLLWREEIRESKLLAPLLMPVEAMTPEEVDRWIDRPELIDHPELTDHLTMHLLWQLPFAVAWAIERIERGDSRLPLALLARRFTLRLALDPADEARLDAQLSTLPTSPSLLTLLHKYIRLHSSPRQLLSRFIDRPEVYKDLLIEYEYSTQGTPNPEE